MFRVPSPWTSASPNPCHAGLRTARIPGHQAGHGTGVGAQQEQQPNVIGTCGVRVPTPGGVRMGREALQQRGLVNGRCPPARLRVRAIPRRLAMTASQTQRATFRPVHQRSTRGCPSRIATRTGGTRPTLCQACGRGLICRRRWRRDGANPWRRDGRWLLGDRVRRATDHVSSLPLRVPFSSPRRPDGWFRRGLSARTNPAFFNVLISVWPKRATSEMLRSWRRSGWLRAGGPRGASRSRC